MAVRGMSHVAIGVRDMDASVAFYRDVLGLRVDFDDIEVMGDGATLPVTRRRGVYLRHDDDPDSAFIVLDQQLGDRPDGNPAELFQIGVHHFGFWVDDVDAIAERARNAGFAVTTGPRDVDSIKYGEKPGRTIRLIFVRDPDGNVVQCDQRMS